MQSPPESIMQLLHDTAYQIRRLSVEMITYSMWGHIGGSFSMAELLAVLYFHHFGLTRRPDWPTVTDWCSWPGLQPLCGVGRVRHAPPAASRRARTRDSKRRAAAGMGLSVATGIALGLRYRETPSRARSASWATAMQRRQCRKRRCPPRITISTT
jgi:transketolase